MKGPKFFSATVALLILLVLSLGPGAAQGPETPQVSIPQAPLVPQTQLGGAFTYQGYLASDGTPVDNSCTFQFSLYDNLVTGTLVAGPLGQPGVAVTDGYFTALLDFGSVFDGTALWLEIAVQCTGDAGYTTLAPRQELTAAPYALSLQPGAVISGTVAGSILTAINQNDYGIAIVGLQPGYDPYDMSSFWEPGGFFGGQNGVIGYSKKPDGYGVIGYASTSVGDGHGVHGVSESSSGVGVYGWNSASGGPAYGVYGGSSAGSGFGVYGYASHGSGYTSGVFGEVASTNGYGVYGFAGASSGIAAGVYGITYADGGRGVSGRAYASTGTTIGVYGKADSPSGYGVYYVGGLGGSGLQTTVVETPDHGWRHLYNGASTTPLFEDLGSARLVDGRVEVAIDPLFAQAVNLSAGYYVFTTALSDEPVLLFIPTQTSTSFTVQGATLDGQPADCSFHYRIVAKRLGYEDTRMAPAEDPNIVGQAGSEEAGGQR